MATDAVRSLIGCRVPGSARLPCFAVSELLSGPPPLPLPPPPPPPLRAASRPPIIERTCFFSRVPAEASSAAGIINVALQGRRGHNLTNVWGQLVSQGDATEKLAHQVAAPVAAAHRRVEEASGDPHEEEKDEAHESSKGHVSGPAAGCPTSPEAPPRRGGPSPTWTRPPPARPTVAAATTHSNP